MKNSETTSTKRRVVVGIATAGVIAGLTAVVAPGAIGAAGGNRDNAGPVATGESADPTVAKKDRWAVVNSDGTFARGKGVTFVETSGTGNYIVHFDKNVRACTYLGTIGLSGASGTESPGFITTVGAAVDVNAVFVTTDDIAGASALRGFHLYVGC